MSWAKTGLRWEKDVTAVGGEIIFPCNKNQWEVKLWRSLSFAETWGGICKDYKVAWVAEKRVLTVCWDAPCFFEWVQFWEIWCLGNRLLWFRRFLQICARQAGRLFSLPCWFTSPNCRTFFLCGQPAPIDWHLTLFHVPKWDKLCLGVRSDYKPSYILEQEWEAKQKATRDANLIKLVFLTGFCVLDVYNVKFPWLFVWKASILYHSCSLRRPLKPSEERDGRRRWKGIMKLVKGSCSCWVLLLGG